MTQFHIIILLWRLIPFLSATLQKPHVQDEIELENLKSTVEDLKQLPEKTTVVETGTQHGVSNAHLLLYHFFVADL